MSESVIYKQKTNEISLKELILKTREWYIYILSKWMIILFFGFLGGLIGLTYVWLKKPIYTATTTFVLEEGEKGGGLGQYAGLASMVGIDIGAGGGGSIFQVDNVMILYKSRTMIQKTLLTEVNYNNKKELLIDRYIEFNNLRETWRKNSELAKINFKLGSSFTRLQDSVLGTIVNDISEKHLFVSKLDKKLSIIKTEVKSTDEFFAKVFNEQIVKNVNDFYTQTKTKKSLTNVLILQQKTDSVRAVMNRAIYSGAAAADATPNLNPTRQVQRVVPMQSSQFNAETNKAILEELVKNLELSKISLRKEMPLIQVIDEPIFPLEREKISKVKGFLVGGVLFVFCVLFFLVFRRVYKGVLLNDEML